MTDRETRRANNVEILEDTLKFFKSGKGPHLTGEITSISLLTADDIEELPGLSGSYRTKFMCFNEDSFECASRFKDDKVLVLNLASATRPGGGVRKGSSAQEEELCRRSSLLLSLESTAASRYYYRNRKLETKLGSNSCILTPVVDVVKDTSREYIEPFTVSVITCAAPNIRYGLEGLSDKEYCDLFRRRINAMLKCAGYWGYKTLVLGAWGCGAFANDANRVAGFFKDAFDGPAKGAFETVAFAVLDRNLELGNFNAFNSKFG